MKTMKIDKPFDLLKWKLVNYPENKTPLVKLY